MKKLLRILKNLFESNKLFANFFDFVTGTSIYKFLLDLRIKYSIKKINRLKRYNIIIETTNICNARCIMCPHPQMKRKRGIMTEEIFSLILDKIKQDNINPTCFILNGFGEPLVDRDIVKRIKTIRKGFPDSAIKFYTNLSLANDKKLKNLVLSGINEINVSFNGFNPKNYERVMGLNYQKTKVNLLKLIELKNKFNTDLKIRISMALVSVNQSDFKKFLIFWESKVDSVSVNRIHTYGDSVKDVSGEMRINFDKTPSACKYIWDTIVFDFEGNLVLCCLDYESKYKFGNIKKDGVLKIFNSVKFEAIRKMHLRRDIKKLNICRKCYTPYKNGVEWWINNLY